MSFFTEKASSGDFVKFDDSTINQPIAMEITAPYTIKPSVYKGEQRYTKKGAPVMEAHVPVRLENGEDATFSDGGKWRLQSAVGTAVRASGAPDLEIGGTLTVTFLGKVPTKGGQSANDYRVEYTRPEEGGVPAQGETLEVPAAPQPQVQQGNFGAQQQYGQPQQYGQQQQQQQYGQQPMPQPAFNNQISAANPWGV